MQWEYASGSKYSYSNAAERWHSINKLISIYGCQGSGHL
jgi:hypothetical protein